MVIRVKRHDQCGHSVEASKEIRLRISVADRRGTRSILRIELIYGLSGASRRQLFFAQAFVVVHSRRVYIVWMLGAKKDSGMACSVQRNLPRTPDQAEYQRTRPIHDHEGINCK